MTAACVPRWVPLMLCGVTAGAELAIDPNLFVNPATHQLIDPWIYSGYFLTLPAQAARFPGTYYGSRLSVVAPGFVVHWLFGPAVATYAWHIGVFCGVVLSAYALVRRGAGEPIALVSAAILAWNPLIIAAVGWDYVDGIGMAFFMGALLALDASARGDRRRPASAAAAGFFAALLVTTNLFLIVLLPILGLFLLLRTTDIGWRPTVRIAVFAILGAAGAAIVLAAVNVKLGSSGFFLAPQIREAQSLVAARNPWKLHGYGWLAYATWLVFPATATLAAAFGVARWARSRRPPSFAAAIQLTFLATVVLWAAIQVWSTPVLQISYYSSYLVPLGSIALALEVGPVFDVRRAVAVSVVFGAMFAAGEWLMLANPTWFWGAVGSDDVRRVLERSAQFGPEHAEAALATLAAAIAGVVAVAILRWRTPSWPRWAAFAFALAVVYGAAPQFWTPATAASGRTWFVDTAAAHRYIEEQATGHPLRIWYALDPRSSRPFKSISSTFLWGYVLVNEDMPTLTRRDASTLTVGTRLAVLAPTAADAELARAPLNRFGLDYRIVGSRQFGTGNAAFAVTISDVVSAVKPR